LIAKVAQTRLVPGQGCRVFIKDVRFFRENMTCPLYDVDLKDGFFTTHSSATKCNYRVNDDISGVVVRTGERLELE
jgi:hypothetical protein